MIFGKHCSCGDIFAVRLRSAVPLLPLQPKIHYNYFKDIEVVFVWYIYYFQIIYI